MSISRIATAVALVLTAAAALAITPLGAQEGEGDLVSTACAAGFLQKCGTEPTHETCEWEISFNKTGGSILGFSFGFQKCTYHGSRDLYKDYMRGANTGACIVNPKPVAPADNTRVTPEEESLSEC